MSLSFSCCTLVFRLSISSAALLYMGVWSLSFYSSIDSDLLLIEGWKGIWTGSYFAVVVWRIWSASGLLANNFGLVLVKNFERVLFDSCVCRITSWQTTMLALLFGNSPNCLCDGLCLFLGSCDCFCYYDWYHSSLRKGSEMRFLWILVRFASCWVLLSNWDSAGGVGRAFGLIDLFAVRGGSFFV